jgi:hypothetical protein
MPKDMPRFSRFSGALLGAALVATVLAACSPSFDWRTVTNDDGGFSVMFPAKVTLDERQLNIDGHPMKMQMQAAKANDVVFAVGVVTLPDDSPALQRAVQTFLQDGLARNVGSKPVTQAAKIRLSEPSQQIDATQMDVSGPVPGGHDRRVIHALFAARGRHVYQAVVIAGKNPTEDQMSQFFDSLRLY